MIQTFNNFDMCDLSTKSVLIGTEVKSILQCCEIHFGDIKRQVSHHYMDFATKSLNIVFEDAGEDEPAFSLLWVNAKRTVTMDLPNNTYTSIKDTLREV